MKKWIVVLILLAFVVLLSRKCVESFTDFLSISDGQIKGVSSTELVVCDQSTCTAPKPFSSITIGNWIMAEDSAGRLVVKKGADALDQRNQPYYKFGLAGDVIHQVQTITATGTFTASTVDNTTYYRFTGAGTIQCLITDVPQVLVVAGGGGGHGCNATAADEGGCGGGGGGLAHGTATLTAGTVYTIVVGAGGLGYNAGSNTAPKNGNESKVTGSDVSIIVSGGGAGGRGSTTPGGRGGSGGGGSTSGGVQPMSMSGNVSLTSRGNIGGTSVNASGQTGGGGAGAAGGTAAGWTAGSGGAGYQWINGTTYAGGGGGGTRNVLVTIAGTGGSGGGGNGSNSGSGTSGTTNTGGGGGGGAGRVISNGGSGGSGVVVFAFVKI